MDDFQDQETYEYTILPLKNLGTHEDVWIHFCKLMKNGEVVGQSNVFCTKCLDNGITQSYPCLSPISIFKNHLVSEHAMTEFQYATEMSQVEGEMNLMAVDDVIAETLTDPNKELQQIDCIEYLDAAEMIDDTNVIDTSRKTSGAWRFFTQIFDEKEDAEFMYCNFCLKTDDAKRYKSTTATTNLLKHLRKHHSKEIAANSADDGLSAIKRVFVKTSDVWKYYCKLTKDNVVVDEDYVYCGKCLEHNVKKKYRKTTSTRSLRQHLLMYHDISLEDAPETNCNGKDSQNKFQGNKVSKIRLYFKKLESDAYHHYCIFCLKDKCHQKYRITTSTSSLKNHLLSKHNFDPDVDPCPDSALKPDDDQITEGQNLEKEIPDEPEEQLQSVAEQTVIGEPCEDDLIEIVETYSDDDYEHIESLELDQELQSKTIADESTEMKGYSTKLIVKYCRSCCKNPEGCYTKFSNQFEDEETSNRTLHDLYFDVTGIRPNDCLELSQLICYECEAKLKFAFKFRQLALKTEEMMTEKIALSKNPIDSESIQVNEYIIEVPKNALELNESVFDDESEHTSDMKDIEILEPTNSEPEVSVELKSTQPTTVKKRKSVQKRKQFEEQTPLDDGVLPVPVSSLCVKSTPTIPKPTAKIKLIATNNAIDDESDTELAYCDRRFGPETELLLIETPSLTCETCQLTLDTLNTLLQHNQDQHGSQLPYKADCRKRFATKHELELHNNYMHEKQSCSICNILFNNQHQLNEHSAVHASSIPITFQLFNCVECDVLFSNETSHMLHMAEHDRYYNCENCSSKFKKKSELVLHKKRRHRFVCDTCGNSFASQNNLEVHYRSHTGSRPYSCNMCDKHLISADALKVHLKYVHNAFGSTAKTCTICGKTFNSKNGFFRHNRIHTGELFECDVNGCGKKFTGRSVLKKHIELVHDDVRAYQCSKCPKRYKTNAHLTKHVETEHLKLKFVCPLCNKTISNRWDFNYHVKRSHPGQLDAKPIEIRLK